MSISSKFDPDVGILFTTADGQLSLDEIHRHLDSESCANEIAYPELFDATQARTNLTATQVRELVKRITDMRRKASFGPTAVICTDDVVCGMANMLGILSEIQGGPQIQAFRTFDEGLEWLIRMKGA